MHSLFNFVSFLDVISLQIALLPQHCVSTTKNCFTKWFLQNHTIDHDLWHI